MGEHQALTNEDRYVPWRGDATARPSAGHGLTERYQEGLGWDSDMPDEFLTGLRQGYETGARPNQNKNVYEKPREQLTAERAAQLLQHRYPRPARPLRRGCRQLSAERGRARATTTSPGSANGGGASFGTSDAEAQSINARAGI
jgi:hypothetical protein